MDGLRRQGQVLGQLYSHVLGMGVPRVEPQPFPVGEMVGTLLGVKRPVLIASTAERGGRHGSFRGCLKAGGDWRNCCAGPEGSLIKKTILRKKNYRKL